MSSPERTLGGDDFDAEISRFFDEAGTVEESIDTLQDEVGLELIRASLLDKLPEYGVEHQVVSSDIEHQAQLFAMYTTWFRGQAVYNLQFSFEGVQSADYARISSDMIIAYYEEREFQSIVVHCAAKIADAYVNGPEHQRNKFIVEGTKKELQADFMLHYGRKPNDPMLVFFAAETPGDNLDATDPGDKQYLDVSRAKYDRFKQNQAKKHEVLDAAKNLLGMDEESGEEEIAYATHILIEMILEASLATTGRRPNRTAALTETARLLGRSNPMTNALVALMEAYYPMQAQ